MKLAILTPNRIQSRILINALQKKGVFLTVIFYSQKNKATPFFDLQKIKKAIKSTLFYFKDEERIRRVRDKNEHNALKALSDYALRNKISTEFENQCFHVDDVNSNQTLEILKSNNIEVLFIWGIPILKKPVIESVPIVLNAHSSVLPEYRGAKSEFWQFFHQDFNHAGITIHKVDVGVDTGDIGVQIRSKASDLETPEYLKMLNAIRVIEAFPKFFNDLENQQVEWVRQEDLQKPKSKTYRMKDVGMAQLRSVYLKS